MCESHFAREIMSLLKWIKVEKPVLPSSSTRAYSSLTSTTLTKKLNTLLKLERTRKLQPPLDYVMHCCALRTRSRLVGHQFKNNKFFWETNSPNLIPPGDWFSESNARQIFYAVVIYWKELHILYSNTYSTTCDISTLFQARLWLSVQQKDKTELKLLTTCLNGVLLHMVIHSSMVSALHFWWVATNKYQTSGHHQQE